MQENKFVSFLILFLLSLSLNVYGKHKLNENVPAELMINMKSWILSMPEGTVRDLADGKIYRIKEGARFTDSMGISVVVPLEKPDYNYIANKSPSLTRYWDEKYHFKPLPLDYERDSSTVVDDKLSFFDSLTAAMAIDRTREADLRNKLSAHPSVTKNFSCVSAADNLAENAEVRSLCGELIKSGTEHHNLFLKIQKEKSDLDSRGKNDLVIPPDAVKFEKDFSPFIFKAR